MIPFNPRKLLRKGAPLIWPSDYFITILTKDRNPIFGSIENGEMILNEFGQIAQKIWLRTESVYSYTKLYEFIIMPDHIHGIIRILPSDQKVKSISTMVKSFKREVTKEIRLLDPSKSKLIWQQSFWVRGFNNEIQLKAYEKYIKNNPKKEWEKKQKSGQNRLVA